MCTKFFRESWCQDCTGQFILSASLNQIFRDMELSKFEIIFPVKYLGAAKIQFHALTLSQPGSWSNIYLENKG